MNSIKATLLAVLLALGCAAQDDGYDAPAAEPRQAIDVMPIDKYLYSEEVTDDQYDGGEIGSTEQAWKSAEYYGLSSGENPCYASGTNGKDCDFPSSKTVKLQVDKSACGSEFDIPLVFVRNGFIQGMKDWNGHGGATVTETTASGGLQVRMNCQTGLSDNGLAQFEHATVRTQVANLPIGPHGGDPGRARQYDGGNIRLDVTAAWNYARVTCGFTSQAQLESFGREVGRHEMGHALGFDHTVLADIMYKFASCSVSPNPHGILASRDAALNHYSGSTSGGVTIVDDGLPHP